MKARFVSAFVIFFLLVGFSSIVRAQGLPRAAPEDVGLSSERLERISKYLQGQIERGEIAGVIALVARRGKIAYLKAFGMADVETGKTMTIDTMFRMCSSTKKISAVAGMIAWEEGGFQLWDPVAMYIPALKDLKVIQYDPKDRTKYETVPARSPMLVYHAFNFTAGLTYNGSLGGPALTKMKLDAGLNNGFWPNDYDLAEYFIKRSQIPLLNHPGEEWNYGMDLQVVARLVEISSGMKFGDFCHERIFKPLGMKDTYFFVPDEKLPRVATLYLKTETGLERTVRGETYQRPEVGIEEPTDPFWFTSKGPQKFFAAGEGSISTIEDYARFLEMLLNKGELNGVRILGRKTVEFMTSDHIGDIPCCRQMFGPLMAGYGWGMGMAVYQNQAEGHHIGTDRRSSNQAQFMWGGWMGTSHLVDPAEDMILLIMSQRLQWPQRYVNTFRDLAYHAIID